MSYSYNFNVESKPVCDFHMFGRLFPQQKLTETLRKYALTDDMLRFIIKSILAPMTKRVDEGDDSEYSSMRDLISALIAYQVIPEDLLDYMTKLPKTAKTIALSHMVFDQPLSSDFILHHRNELSLDIALNHNKVNYYTFNRCGGSSYMPKIKGNGFIDPEVFKKNLSQFSLTDIANYAEANAVSPDFPVLTSSVIDMLTRKDDCAFDILCKLNDYVNFGSSDTHSLLNVLVRDYRDGIMTDSENYEARHISSIIREMARKQNMGVFSGICNFYDVLKDHDAVNPVTLSLITVTPLERDERSKLLDLLESYASSRAKLNKHALLSCIYNLTTNNDLYEPECARILKMAERHQLKDHSDRIYEYLVCAQKLYKSVFDKLGYDYIYDLLSPGRDTLRFAMPRKKKEILERYYTFEILDDNSFVGFMRVRPDRYDTTTFRRCYKRACTYYLKPQYGICDSSSEFDIYSGSRAYFDRHCYTTEIVLPVKVEFKHVTKYDREDHIRCNCVTILD